MSKINALKKKAAIKKYGEGLKSDYDATVALMTEDGYSEEEIFQINEALSEEEPAKDEKPVKDEKPGKTVVSKNPVFEKWRVKVEYVLDKKDKPVIDEDGNPVVEITKFEYLRDAKISDKQAELLNSQSANTKIKYYKK